MFKEFENYIQSISSKFSHVETSEMGYRTDFEILIKAIFESINVKRIDHDAKAQFGNKPDFVVLKHDVPILYIEVKDIGTSLDKVEKSEQMARYYGYANLVLTDYVEFRFYRNGVRYEEPIKIANFDIKNRAIAPISENYEHVAKTLIDFTQTHKEPIRSGKHLSKIMGGKAQRIRDNVRQFLSYESDKNKELINVYETIKKLLVHDLTLEAFADMYAQTLVYGLFVARYFDETPDNFTRQEARDLVPASNPLLRHFFDHIVGPDFDKRLEYIVNELCEVFTHANIPELMRQYYENDLWGQAHEGPDPVIHFYEDFLKEYDAELRKRLGAFYTPLPVVRFIVRAVDHILEKDFNLSQGLTNTSKTENVHRVQILDPAVGTGTFITEVIHNIYARFKNQTGRWPKYVYSDLLPRLHGFELMMAPYTIAHLKMSLVLKETGFKYFNSARLGIYLTNSLEMASPQQELFAFDFAASIAEESKEAAKIKTEKPIMVVIGNPPYSVSSSNKGQWIQNLIEVYKEGLNEKKLNLDDDYIKFIRFAEHFIEKNGVGVVAMITNNSFINGITHRQMRKHLLETFDDIYILDLHGSSKKNETTPSGGKDENVFDIQQGVSISIFVRKENIKEKLGTVYHVGLHGKREDKFKALDESSLQTIGWKKLDYFEPYYFFVPKDFKNKEEYEKGFEINKLFSINSSGTESAKDNFIVKFSDMEIPSIKNFIEVHSDKEIAETYHLKIEKAEQVKNDFINIVESPTKLLYRPFDIRYTLYSPHSQGVWWRPKYEVMKHLVKDNLALVTCRQQTSFGFQHVFVAKNIVERCAVSLQTGEVNYVFPLYLYEAEDNSRKPNLNEEIVDEIEKITGKTTPENIFDYIYAVLHSPSYRNKYKEFLKINFPRVPYPKDVKIFQRLVSFGKELRSLHLLESPKVNHFITTYPIMGTDTVEKIDYKNSKVFINDSQFFGDVPEIAWNFYIGGYQPAQKWLKDRKGRTLTNEDIEHYQRMIVALMETDKLMKEIDKYDLL